MSKPTTGPFEKKPKGWLDRYEGPRSRASHLPAGSVDAHCPSSGRAGSFPMRPNANTRPDASKAAFRAASSRFARVVQACHGVTTARWRTPAVRRNGKARGVATVRRSVTDEELKRPARSRRARRAIQFRQAPRRLHAQGRVDGNRRRIAPLGGMSSSFGRSTCGTLGLLHRFADHPSSSITWAVPT